MTVRSSPVFACSLEHALEVEYARLDVGVGGTVRVQLLKDVATLERAYVLITGRFYNREQKEVKGGGVYDEGVDGGVDGLVRGPDGADAGCAGQGK